MAGNETNNAFTTNANIKQFGGNGDGRNSDVKAFRLALATLDKGDGKALSALLLPPGRYLIPAGSQIVVPSGVVIKGVGDDSVLVMGAGAFFGGQNGVTVVFEDLRFETTGPVVNAVVMAGPTGTLQLNHVTADINVRMLIPNGISFIEADCDEIGQDVETVVGGPYTIHHLGNGLWTGTNQPRQIKGNIDPSVGAGYPAPQASIFQSTNGFVYIKTGPADTDWTPIGGAPTPDSDLMKFTVFVAKNGNDVGADGSIAKPFLTVQAAMNYAYTTYVAPLGPQTVEPFTRPCVFVNAGTYDDGPLVLPPQICVMGEGRNHSRIVGDWSIDARWTMPPVSDDRSSWINVGLFGNVVIDFNAFNSSEGKVYADACRFAGNVTFVQKGPVNQGLFADCEFFNAVTCTGVAITLLGCIVYGTLTLNQTTFGNSFETAGGRVGTVVINATSGANPPYAVTFAHQATPGATLTLNGTFSTVQADLTAVPLQTLITLLGGATLQQIKRINPPFFAGPTADRPLAPYVGQEFFDTTIDQTVWWDGAMWVTWSGGGTNGLMTFTVFVAKNGNDGTADGSVNKPFLTVQAAMDYAWNTYVVPFGPQPMPPFLRPCVFVNAGTYDDGPLVLPPQICVLGEGFNHSRITGDWTLDNRWSNYVPPSLPSPPSVLVPNDFRSSFIKVGIFGAINFDFDTVFSNEGKIYALGCRFAGLVTVNEKTSNPVSNSFNVQSCEFIAGAVLGGIPAFIQNSTFLSPLTLNQLAGTGVDNVFASFGSSFSDIIINSTNPAAPAYDLAFSHSVQPAATLTLNGTFITIRGTIDSFPLQTNIILLGGALLTQITRINQPFFSGTTAERPLAPYVGQEFFDTTLDKSIWWDGAAWVTWPDPSTSVAVLVWGNDDIGAAVDSRWMTPGRGGLATLTSDTQAIPLSHPGIMKNLRVRHNTSDGNGAVVNYFIVQNGIVTGLTVTLATGAVGQAVNSVTTLLIAAGDRVELKADKPLAIGAGTINPQVTVEYT